MSDLDPSTGLPKLPSNERWKVVTTTTQTLLYVHRQRRRFGIWWPAGSSGALNNTGSIRDAARRILRDAANEASDRARSETLTGTYPPGNLNARTDEMFASALDELEKL